MDDQTFLDWERELAAEKRAKSRGSASVKLEVLYYNREADEQNTKRLKDLFKKGGHLRLDSCNHVLAIVDPQSLDAAIQASGLSADMLLDNPQGQYNELEFPPGFRLKCLHGLDSARAAAQSLPQGDRRWIVDLFVADLTCDLEKALVEQYACEKVPDAGEFYTFIRQHQLSGHALFEQLWWARLQAVGARREQNLNRILKNPGYRSAFDCQLDMPGLAGGMNLGTAHHMFAMKCDEENLRYLKCVKDTWSRILGNDKLAMKKLDRHTVKAVELTAPGACRRDADQLHSDLTQGRIFGAFTEKERAAIWFELLAASTDRLIPSLFTFFEDARYLRGPAGYMKRLMKLSNDDQVSRTLKHRFTGANQKIDTCMVQVSESQLEARSGNSNDQLELGCRQMWIMMMRSYDDKSMLSNWKNLGHLLGFETRQIQNFARDSVDQDIGPDPESSCHNKQLKRCGTPRRGDQRQDRALLFADALHGTIDTSTGVTSFFVRRSVYLAFFGVPRRTGTEDGVLYQVSISSIRQMDQTEQLPDIQMAELEESEHTELIAQEDPDRRQRQQEIQQHQDREQMRLAKLTQDVGQESNRLSQLQQELDARQKELSKEQFRLDQLSQSLGDQQEQRHTEWDEEQQSKEQQQQRIDQLAQELGAKDVENQQKQEELQKEQQKLDQEQEIQDQHTQYLATKKVENQQKQEELQKEQQKLDQQQASQDQLARDLAMKEAENQQRQEEIQKVQQRQGQLTEYLALEEVKNQQKQEELHKEQQKLNQQQQGQVKLTQYLTMKEAENQQRQERLQKEQQKLDQQQEEQGQLAQDLETQRKLHQSAQNEQNQRQQALEQKRQVLVAKDSLFAQEREHEHDHLEPVVLGKNQQEQEAGELTDHWREEHKKRLPASKSKTKMVTSTSRVDNHSPKQGRPVTQIDLGKRASIKPVDRDTAIQSKEERRVLKEPYPEPEIPSLTRPTLDIQQDLVSDENEDRHDLTFSDFNQSDPTHITEHMSPKDTAAVRPAHATPALGQKRKIPGTTKQWESAFKQEEHNFIQRRRITQLGSLAQQQNTVSGQLVRRQPGDTLAALPVLITFKTYNGEAWVVKQIVQTNVDDPEPVRRAAEKHQSDAMKLYDSHNRVLSIETCMEDVLQDRTKTIFLFPIGEKIPSTSKTSETIDLQSGEESL